MPTELRTTEPERKARPFEWIIPAVLAMLLIVSATTSLAIGLIPPDLIGADGLAATVVGTR